MGNRVQTSSNSFRVSIKTVRLTEYFQCPLLTELSNQLSEMGLLNPLFNPFQKKIGYCHLASISRR